MISCRWGQTRLQFKKKLRRPSWKHGVYRKQHQRDEETVNKRRRLLIGLNIESIYFQICPRKNAKKVERAGNPSRPAHVPRYRTYPIINSSLIQIPDSSSFLAKFHATRCAKTSTETSHGSAWSEPPSVSQPEGATPK